MTENVTSAELAFAEEDMQKTYGCPKKYQVEIPAKIKKKLACMQEILVLLQQLKGLLLNIRNILLPEPQLTPGRRSAMTLTGKENWKTQPVKLWYAKKSQRHSVGNKNGSGSYQQAHKYSNRSG